MRWCHFEAQQRQAADVAVAEMLPSGTCAILLAFESSQQSTCAPHLGPQPKLPRHVVRVRQAQNCKVSTRPFRRLLCGAGIEIMHSTSAEDGAPGSGAAAHPPSGWRRRGSTAHRPPARRPRRRRAPAAEGRRTAAPRPAAAARCLRCRPAAALLSRPRSLCSCASAQGGRAIWGEVAMLVSNAAATTAVFSCAFGTGYI